MSEQGVGAAVVGQSGRMVSFRQAVGVWTRIALLSFGGPAGQIAMMHRVLVDEKRWISERRFLHALNYCMLLPGPEATQLITYIGWLMFGTWGGIVAGTLFILPGFVALLGLSLIYVTWNGAPLVAGLFYGLKAAVIAVVIEALVRIGRRALRGPPAVAIAAISFVAIFLFAVPFPAIVGGAALLGVLGHRWKPEWFTASTHGNAKPTGSEDGKTNVEGATLISDGAGLAAGGEPSAWRSLRVAGAWLAAWWLPVAGLALLFGVDHVLVREALFFSKAAVVTFGGAYAVLPYIGQQAVEHYRWLTAPQMLDGLGLAETTPGPLIMVLQFVGFLGAYHAAAADRSMPPLLAGLLGSLVTVWTTFVPCFLWVFVGAPYIERLRHAKALSAALAGVTAAVVGVILNLAVWFALHALFARGERFDGYGLHLWVPEARSIDVVAVGITLLACVALFRVKVSMPWTLAICAVAGLAAKSILPAAG